MAASPQPQGLSRLLQALDYPRTTEFNLEDAGEVSRLVTWVEDRKIRMYDISERAGLRQPGPEWADAFQQYLTACECPYPWTEMDDGGRVRCLRWLLTKALACEYEDAGETYNASATAMRNEPTTSTHHHQGGGASSSSSTIPKAELSSRINALVGALQIKTDQSQDINKQLEAMLSLVQTRLSPSVLLAIKSPPAERPKIDDFPLSFSTGDLVVDRVARALTMLYVNDLRELQNEINDMVVSVQSFTANPKTNTALGRVGR